MWQERAYRARRDIAALAASGLGVGELHSEAIRVIGRDVKTELMCWATLDPETLVISRMTSGQPRIPAEFEPLLADAEYSSTEPYTFAAMATRNEALTRMSDLPLAEHDKSTRFHNVWHPLGMSQELRLLFISDRACWGAAGLVRTGSDFTAREVEYLAAVAPAIAGATRVAVRTDLSRRWAGGAPGIVVVTSSGVLVSATHPARIWREKLDDIESGRFAVIMRLMATGALSSDDHSFRARMSVGQGEWAILQASTLIGEHDDHDVAISIGPAEGEQLTSLLFVAYELSPREQDVCREVIAGFPTAAIARHLFVGANTVQDHLKSAFAKVGVRSRGELVARLQPHPASQPNGDLL